MLGVVIQSMELEFYFKEILFVVLLKRSDLLISINMF